METDTVWLPDVVRVGAAGLGAAEAITVDKVEPESINMDEANLTMFPKGVAVPVSDMSNICIARYLPLVD